jgi:hypothetical protein
VIASIMVAYAVFCYSDNVLGYLSFDWSVWFLFGSIFALFYQDHAQLAEDRQAHNWRSRTREEGLTVSHQTSRGRLVAITHEGQ